MLERYAHVPDVTAKATLVKLFQTGREFSALPFPSITMESVFRSGPLPSPSIVARNSPVFVSAVASGPTTAGNTAAPGAANPSTKSPPTTNGKGATSPTTSPATYSTWPGRVAAAAAGTARIATSR
ncbi:hypothetical protein B0T26DRAFT_228365 [Lasiosphaeria miniovina]|uniref:Uncharacterized protein n=1 Tax=Lasiosphaeria miniovina TaxID=1954250 RepID=A0AA40AV78_9PEZI|nr:uncharacterized protein B0T26DRAFT_228365 [Lasiosphaeria miniovina]KAK0722642.1 hypothetical protein B0T26DRAFT_228365 [Lasiosphaeria miniovina]